MQHEAKQHDLKLTFNSSDERAKVDLIKNLIAMANSGGGEIIFGCDETSEPGVEEQVVDSLDSARLADFAYKFTKPINLDLSHAVRQLENGYFLCSVHVAAVEYPIVMAEKGDWRGMDSGRDKSLFVKGDIWVRHSSKTERATYEDLRRWMEQAKKLERDLILERFTKIINVPENAEIQIVTAADTAIDTPQRLLEYATKRRESDHSHLLSARELAWLFLNRHFLQLADAQSRLLIASALRRSATLYWWLIQMDDKVELVVQELNHCLDAADRDKSDAARSITELAAIYANDEQLDSLLKKLRSSRYKHFREAANEWHSRKAQCQQLCERICHVQHGLQIQNALTQNALEEFASQLASNLSDEKGAANSRKLGDVTRVIWSQRSIHANFC